MDLERMNSILNNDNKFDIYYKERPVWVQGINENDQMAKIGFVDNFEEKDVFIKDLYERVDCSSYSSQKKMKLYFLQFIFFNIWI